MAQNQNIKINVNADATGLRDTLDRIQERLATLATDTPAPYQPTRADTARLWGIVFPLSLALWGAWMLFAWNWVIVSLGAARIQYGQAVALAFVLQIIVSRTRTSSGPSEMRWARRAGFQIGHAGASLSVLWILAQFL